MNVSGTFSKLTNQFSRESFAGAFGRSIYKHHPSLGAAGIFAVGAAGYGAISTGLSTEGSIHRKADDGITAGVKYGGIGLGVAGVGLAAASRPGLYQKAGEFLGSGSRNTASNLGTYFRGIEKELSLPGGWKTTLNRTSVGLGLGMGAGATLGAMIDKDHRGRGAAIGGAVGAGATVGVKAALNVNKSWKAMPGLGKFGLIASATAAIGLGAHTMVNKNNYESVDTAGSSVGERNQMIGASGDIVFGLHNRR